MSGMRRIVLPLFVLLMASACPAQSWPDRLSAAIDSGTLGDAVLAITSELKPALESLDTPDEHLIDLAAWYRFAWFFSRVELKEDLDKNCLKWLVRQPKLMRSVSLAVGGSDQPDKVLNVIRALYRTDRETMEEWPDLVAALAVVWDAPPNDTSDDAAARGDWAVWLYDYYTRNNSRLRYNLKEVPWQLQTYIVDLVVSQEEIAWVWQRYGKRGDVGSFYFDVAYDTNAFYQGAEKKIGDAAYTLDNLQKHGGICVDQAYFATQVGRALGVPTVTIIGQGGAGEIGHAWVGFLDKRGKSMMWNLRSARYEQQLYWTGKVTDPQTRNEISESETSMLGELQNTTPAQRAKALAIIRSLDLFEPARQVDLVLQALNLSAGDREAWLKLADLGAFGAMSADQVKQVAEVVKKFASKQYADLAFQVYQRMLAGKPNLEQLEQYDVIAAIFKDRPDLVATVRVEQGKLHRALKRNDAALKAWGDVLTNHLYAGPIVLEALRLTDEMLREQKDLRRLAGIYDRVFSQIPRPTPSAFAQYAPYCVVGLRYAELLDDMRDRANAQKVRMRVAAYDKSVQINSPSR